MLLREFVEIRTVSSPLREEAIIFFWSQLVRISTSSRISKTKQFMADVLLVRKVVGILSSGLPKKKLRVKFYLCEKSCKFSMELHCHFIQ